MSEQSSQWSEVGQRLEALALKLKLHFEQTGRRSDGSDVIEKLRTSVNEAFEAAGNAVRDDAVRSDVRDAGRLFVDAVSGTFAKVSEDLKAKADSMKTEPPTTATAEAPSAETPPAEPSKPIDPA